MGKSGENIVDTSLRKYINEITIIDIIIIDMSV
jgi:hypothetical protein